jgi:hypothetical protein
MSISFPSIATPDPTILTNAPFVVSGSSAVPMTCSTILQNANGATSVNRFLDIYHLDTNATSNPSGSLQRNLISFNNQLNGATDLTRQISSSDPNLVATNTFFRNLDSIYLPVIQLVDTCLKESLQVDTTDLLKAQANVDQSKSRLDSITNPEQDVSYYEGWFPIVRPMTEPALFGLFGAAIFMLLLSVLVFLRLTGVQIDIQIPQITFFTLPPNASYYMYGGLAVGILGGIGYAYYLNRK